MPKYAKSLSEGEVRAESDWQNCFNTASSINVDDFFIFDPLLQNNCSSDDRLLMAAVTKFCCWEDEVVMLLSAGDAYLRRDWGDEDISGLLSVIASKSLYELKEFW